MNESVIIDVRTPAEFAYGHVEGSMNIPLQILGNHLDELKKSQDSIILCCASGNRSSQAVQFLKSQGIACQDGGSWMDVQYELSNL